MAIILYFIIPSGWTIVFSILYLAVMASWYFDPGQSGQVDSMCTGLTLNYIFLLAFISTFILRLILNFSWEDTTCGVIFTFMVSAIAYIASMFEVNYKEWSWLIFQFKRFGMRPSIVSMLSIKYYCDVQRSIDTLDNYGNYYSIDI